MVQELALRMVIALQGALSRMEEERGQTLAEYSLIISAVAVATVVITVIAFRTVLANTYNSVTDCLTQVSC